MAEGSEFWGMGRLVVPFFHGHGHFAASMAWIIGLGAMVCLYPAIKAAKHHPHRSNELTLIKIERKIP